MKAIMRNLKNQIGAPSNQIMYCPICHAEYSANRSDYWDRAEDYKFACCGKTMDIVTKVTKYRK